MKISKALLRFTFLVMGYCLFIPTVQSQDFVGMYKKFMTRLKEDPLKMSGGVSINTDFIASSDTLRNQSPFNYRIAANLNFDLMGVRIPLSFNYSKAQTVYNYKLPSYSFIGISPTYKWATLHLGDRSMEFSPYTLSGQTFYGLGVELKPGKYNFAAMYGRLRKPVQETISTGGNEPAPAFKRMAWGVKGGYDNGKTAIGLIVFHAKDDPNSIDSLIQYPTLRPAENLVLGLNSKRQLGKIMSLSIEYAMSAMTQNILEQEVDNENSTISKNINNAFNFNLSTQYYNAFKSTLGFNFKKGLNLQLNYERVDPGYRSLGTMYFNDNMENYTIGTTTSLFQKKLNLSSNIGVQRTNLDKSQLNSSLRFVGSLNANYKASERLNFSSAYSNFRNTNIREVSIESLETASTTTVSGYNSVSFITQVSQNANLSSSYLAGKNKKATIAALLSYQESNSIENGTPLVDQQSKYYIASLTYGYALQDQGMNISASMMANYGELPLSDLLSLAPTIAVTKSLFEKTLNLTSAFSYSRVYAGNLLANRLFSGQLGIQYSKFKEHPIGLNIRYVHRGTVPGNESTKMLSEVTGSITYSYRFAPKLWGGRKKEKKTKTKETTSEETKSKEK